MFQRTPLPIDEDEDGGHYSHNGYLLLKSTNSWRFDELNLEKPTCGQSILKHSNSL